MVHGCTFDGTRYKGNVSTIVEAKCRVGRDSVPNSAAPRQAFTPMAGRIFGSCGCSIEPPSRLGLRRGCLRLHFRRTISCYVDNTSQLG